MRVFEIQKLAEIFTYNTPVSMSYSFNGLTKLITEELKKPADKGDLFVFMNKRRNYLKILFYCNDGWCLFAKKLDKGFFNTPARNEISVGELWKIVDHVVLNFGEGKLLEE